MDKISHFFVFGKNHIRCFEDTDLFEQILCRICFDPHCQIMRGLKKNTDCDTIIDEQNKEVTSKSLWNEADVKLCFLSEVEWIAFYRQILCIP